MNTSERRRLASMKERLERNDCSGALLILRPMLLRKASDKAKATRARKSARKAAKSETRKEKTTALRAACLKRSGGRCEWCRMVGFSEFNPGHMHHTEGGAGRRREKQTIENVVMLCGYCHRGYHARPGDHFYRNAALTHCRKYSYRVPSVLLRAAVPRRSANV